IQRATRLFDKLYVTVAHNSGKRAPTFTPEERIAILKRVTARWPNVECTLLDGLTVHYAKSLGARFIMRGLRVVSDFEFELQLAITNQQLENQVETIFLAPAPEFIFLSSSTVREVWRLGGDISRFVPPEVLEALKSKT